MFTFYHAIWSMSSMNRKGTSRRPKCLLVVMKTMLEIAEAIILIGVPFTFACKMYLCVTCKRAKKDGQPRVTVNASQQLIYFQQFKVYLKTSFCNPYLDVV